jgi:hypothetical protein
LAPNYLPFFKELCQSYFNASKPQSVLWKVWKVWKGDYIFELSYGLNGDISPACLDEQKTNKARFHPVT